MRDLRILIVEDERIVARDIQNMLGRQGYTTTFIASSGKEAIELAEETQPDSILMDIKLKEDMDGIEAAKQIRTRFYIPIIYMSALSDKESLVRAEETKPFFFISKPIEERVLKATIEKAYSIQHMRSKSLKHKQQIEKRFRHSHKRNKLMNTWL